MPETETRKQIEQMKEALRANEEHLKQMKELLAALEKTTQDSKDKKRHED
jgi:hypothetical protein